MRHESDRQTDRQTDRGEGGRERHCVRINFSINTGQGAIQERDEGGRGGGREGGSDSAQVLPKPPRAYSEQKGLRAGASRSLFRQKGPAGADERTQGC